MKKKARKPAKKRARKTKKKRVARRPGTPFSSGPRNAGHDISHVTETIPKTRNTGTVVSRAKIGSGA